MNGVGGCEDRSVFPRSLETMTSSNTAPRSSNGTESEEPTLSIPLVEEAIEYEGIAQKPSWRGWIHLVTVPVALIAGIILVVLAHGAEAKIASAVFAVSSLALFGVSATYHRFTWSERAKAILRRADHSNIFVLIAGTYTPLAALGLPDSQGNLLIALVWSGALVGIGLRIFWIGAPRWLYVPLYLILGWLALMCVPELLEANVAMVVLVFVGGALYTVGAAVYATKWPNPSTAHFGFHEIFHALTVAAFLCHWSAALLIALNPI